MMKKLTMFNEQCKQWQRVGHAGHCYPARQQVYLDLAVRHGVQPIIDHQHQIKAVLDRAENGHIDLAALIPLQSTVNVQRRNLDGSVTVERRLVTRVMGDRFVVEGGDMFGTDGEALTRGAGIRASWDGFAER